MNTKLTLSVDQKIIQEIKSYAKSHQVSLSKMVENYFNYLVHKAKPNVKASAIVEELSGIISLPANFNEKEEYYNFLSEKYK
ncbi:MAG: DUF6364 family protein [Candidatus Cloacimonadota bacterium]|nr:DUF6364 family protein [Candidatus Cloacimonadota bacterium]